LQSLKSNGGFSSLRIRLVGTVFLAIAPALAVLYFTHSPWIGFLIGLLALGAAWFGGERFVLRQVKTLAAAAERLTAGDLSARSGLNAEPGEIGSLARSFDEMAASLGRRAEEREQAEQRLLQRAMQQSAVAALGQFALSSDDFAELLNQIVMLVTQTLEVELCQVLELLPDGQSLLLRAGVGWKKNLVGVTVIPTGPETQAGLTLLSGEAVVVADLRTERRFPADVLLREHFVVSGACVAIGTRERNFGALGVYSPQVRTFNSDDVQFLLAVANSLAVAITRRESEAELKKLAGFAQLNPNPALELATDGSLTYCNDAAHKLALALGLNHPADILPPDIGNLLHQCLASGETRLRLESRIKNHTLFWSFHPVPDRNLFHAYVEDITERLNLEQQFRQSQKMESVGQLSAGIAHDFNNLLTVIQGHAGLVLARPQLPEPVRDSVQSIFGAAERAGGLTRQLLTFSRKNVLQPELLDLRELVHNLGKMLQRLLGETVALNFHAPEILPPIRADAGMIEQVLMNLAVNARDAMPAGGTLTLGVESLVIGPTEPQRHPDARPGAFVCLRVSDTGIGMDAETMNRIFEPFFTTKPAGKGTGLGLATVYGIVKQHDGWVETTSVVGSGTTFTIFFPAAPEAVLPAGGKEALAAPVRGGRETVLFVEDELPVLEMGRLVLEDCGYQVFAAPSGVAALDIWQQQQSRISLLLTDIVMPEGISGLDLAQRFTAEKPALKVLFMSGYAIGDIDTEFLHQAGRQMLQKPYTRASLTKAVREILDH